MPSPTDGPAPPAAPRHASIRRRPAGKRRASCRRSAPAPSCAPLCERTPGGRRPPCAKHHRIKAVVIPEFVEHLEAETLAVELDHCGQVRGQTSDTKVRLAEIRGRVHQSRTHQWRNGGSGLQTCETAARSIQRWGACSAHWSISGSILRPGQSSREDCLSETAGRGFSSHPTVGSL
jgi:hypothetical protein